MVDDSSERQLREHELQAKLREVTEHPEVETELLGLAMINRAAWSTIYERLVPGEFSLPWCEEIFRWMVRIEERGGKMTGSAVIAEMRDQGMLSKIGGEKVLHELAAKAKQTYGITVDFSLAAESLCDIILDDQTRRDLIRTAYQMLDHAMEHRLTNAELLAFGRSCLEQIEDGAPNDEVPNDQILALLKEKQTAARAGDRTALGGIKTGIMELDNVIGPMLPGDLITIGGKTGGGKSALAMSIAYTLAILQGKPVAYISAELSREVLAKRHQLMATNRPGPTSNHLSMVQLNEPGTITESRWKQCQSDFQRLEGKPFESRHCYGLTVAKLRQRVKQIRKQLGGLELVIVENVQLINQPGVKDERLALVKITRALKDLAGELGIPIIMLSQVSREAHSVPMKAIHLKESGSIENDSDIVILVDRPDEPDSVDPGAMTLEIAKGRNCGHARMEVSFYKKTMRVVSRGEVI